MASQVRRDLPLLDRLTAGATDFSPRAPATSLKDSVIGEVRRLLGARCARGRWDDTRRRTVIDYGLPDFFHCSPHNADDARQLARIIRETVAAFEPRLVVESVQIQVPRQYRHALLAVITGLLVEGRMSTRIEFSVSIPSIAESERDAGRNARA